MAWGQLYDLHKRQSWDSKLTQVCFGKPKKSVFDSLQPYGLACQASLSMGFSWQEYWSGLPFPAPGDLSDPRIKPGSPAWQGDSLSSEPRDKSKTVQREL